MLTKLNELIAKGGFTGMNVAVRPLSDTELSVIVTAQATALKGDSHIKEDNALDTYYALRQALVTPQVFSGTPEQIDAQITEFVDTIGDSVQSASEQLSSIAKAAKLDAATAQAKSDTEKSAKKDTKKSDTKSASKKATEKPSEPKEADDDSQASNEAVKPTSNEQEQANEESQSKPESKPTNTMAMFDEVESI